METMEVDKVAKKGPDMVQITVNGVPVYSAGAGPIDETIHIENREGLRIRFLRKESKKPIERVVDLL